MLSLLRALRLKPNGIGVFLLIFFWPLVVTGGDRLTPISIVMDDLGYSLPMGKHVIQKLNLLTFSILPATPYTKSLARIAHAANKEVLLHLPMQAGKEMQDSSMLTADMTEEEFMAKLTQHIGAVPFAVGVNNHMGSQLTPRPEQMRWLMQEIALKGLFVVDSRTTHLTVIPDIAAQYRVPYSERDAFLDNDRDPKKIEAAFARFIKIAKRQGAGLIIAHPYPETVKFLETELANLSSRGVRLVTVQQLINSQTGAQ